MGLNEERGGVTTINDLLIEMGKKLCNKRKTGKEMGGQITLTYILGRVVDNFTL